MNDIVFTSIPVCNRLAERQAQGMTELGVEAAHVVSDLIGPLTHKLYANSKMQRGAVKTAAYTLARQLRAKEAIFDVCVDALIGPMSTHETYCVRYIMGMGTDNLNIEFLAVEILLTRRDIEMSLASTDFTISKHAMSRYMQRESKPLKSFFEGILTPLHCSTVISTTSMYDETPAIALPIGSGLLLGRTVGLVDPPMAVQFKIDGKTRPEAKVVQRRTLTRGSGRYITEIKTYVDGPSLFDGREKLRDALNDFEAQHRDGLRYTFETAAFDLMLVRRDAATARHEKMRDAILAGRKLFDSPTWKNYVRSIKTT